MPGVYVDAEQWTSAKLSDRHRAFTAAVGLTTPTAVFCDHTALSLYGVPLLSWPRTVHYRTPFRGKGGHGTSAFFPIHVRLPLKHPGLSTAEAQARRKQGELPIPSVEVPVPGVAFADGSPVSVSVEPLPYVLVDTLPGLPQQDAVVVLDAVMGGRYGFKRRVTEMALDDAEKLLAGTSVGVWKRMRGFADPRSESPGESRARVLFAELGFEPPQLQRQLHLPRVGRVRLDFWWEGVVGEFDGMVKYTRGLSGEAAEDTVQQEKLREDALRMMGYQVVRMTWDDLNHPQELGRKLLLAGVPHRAVSLFTAA